MDFTVAPETVRSNQPKGNGANHIVDRQALAGMARPLKILAVGGWISHYFSWRSVPNRA
jgi:hypothetical protein